MRDKVGLVFFFIALIIPDPVISGDLNLKENVNTSEKPAPDLPSYMYFYCKKTNNPYCGGAYSKSFYINYLLKNKNPDFFSAPQSASETTANSKSNPTPLNKENASLPTLHTQPTSIKANASLNQILYSEPSSINSRSYLAKWIKESFGVELNSRSYSTAQLADIYTRLIWCGKIQKDLKQPCDCTKESTEELQKTYESLKSKVN